MMGGEQKCTRCGFTCDLADAAAHFYRKAGSRTGFDTRCKPCHLERSRKRHAERKDDPHYRELRRAASKASYHRHADRINADHRAARAAAAQRPVAPAKPKAVTPPSHAYMLDTLLSEVDRVLIAMRPEDETLQKFHKVVRAVWAQVAPSALGKGA